MVLRACLLWAGKVAVGSTSGKELGGKRLLSQGLHRGLPIDIALFRPQWLVAPPQPPTATATKAAGAPETAKRTERLTRSRTNNHFSNTEKAFLKNIRASASFFTIF